MSITYNKQNKEFFLLILSPEAFRACSRLMIIYKLRERISRTC